MRADTCRRAFSDVSLSPSLPAPVRAHTFCGVRTPAPADRSGRREAGAASPPRVREARVRTPRRPVREALRRYAVRVRRQLTARLRLLRLRALRVCALR